MSVDAVDWIAMTVKQESEGEPYEGKLAVAFVIVNRMERTTHSASAVVLAPHQFSCWNTESPTRARLEAVGRDEMAVWADCYKAAGAALYHLVDDPTRGATCYLNPAACPRLPDWYDKAAVRAIIGRHEFLVMA